MVTDLRLPGRSAIDLLQALHDRKQSLPTIVITAYAAVHVAGEAMQKGALTLLEKPYRENELWDSIRAALIRDAESRNRELARNEAKSRIEQLTEQERQILAMIVGGSPNQAIAYRLDMGLRTVESRRKSILEKMHVDGIAQLVQKVLLATDDQRLSR